MIRVAAFGDVHMGMDSEGCLAPALDDLAREADVLLVAGDITRCGQPDEVRAFVRELDAVTVPVVAVLGNHDHHAGCPDEVATVLRDGGVTVLEGASTVVELPQGRLGVAGAKGFAGGFVGASGSEFGEAEMKSFIAHTRLSSSRLRAALETVQDADARVALLHYSPIRDTLVGERPELFPFLGSHLLGEAVDMAGCDLVLHGHAHAGTEHGRTPAGIPVRNVAQPVLRAAYRVYTLCSS